METYTSLVGLLLAVTTVGYSQAVPSPHRMRIAEWSSSFERLARSTSSAVVQINVSGYTIVSESEGSTSPALAKEKGVGSGAVLSEDGYIVTNAHVIRGAQRVMVTFHSAEALPDRDDDARAFPARVVGKDLETDLAVLKVERTGLPFLKLGDSDEVRQGQLVVAFGSPLGLSNSMTMGMVSAPSRQLEESDFMQYIQTDAAINPGNSGGPLVDADGNVIGINTMILTQSGGNEGVGLAIPSNLVKTVVEQLETQGRVHRGMIGVDVQTVTPTLAEGLGLPSRSGVLISDVDPEGPASEAGLSIEDVVVAVNGSAIRAARQLELAVFRASAGQVLHLDVMSGGSQKAIDIRVKERPDSPHSLASLTDPKENLIPQLAVMAVTVDKEIAPLLPGLREQTGVAVAALAHQPTAWSTQLQPGDVVHEVNGSRVATLEFLRDKLASLAPGAAVVLQVEHEGTMHYLAFRAE
jgi:serine protease Do